MRTPNVAWLMLLSAVGLPHCRESDARYAFVADAPNAGHGGEGGTQMRASGGASGHAADSGGGRAGQGDGGEYGGAGGAGADGDDAVGGGGDDYGAGRSHAGASAGSGEAGIGGEGGTLDAGAAGRQVGTGGTAGSNGTQSPYCEPAGFPPTDFRSPVAIAAARVASASHNYTSIFSASLELDALAVTWQNVANDDTSWDPWRCFGVLDAPRRLSTDNLPNGLMEVYATLASGDLLVTRSYYTTEGSVTWGNWELVPLPAAHVSDVATSEGPQLHVYVVDRGTIRFRHHLDEVGDDSYTPYSAFHGIPGTETVAVAAARMPDGRQAVFRAISSSSEIAFAEQSAADLGAGFGAWQSLATLSTSAVDLEAVASASGVDLLILDAQGRVAKTSIGDASAGEVAPLDAGDETLRFVSVTSRAYPEADPVFYALGNDGLVYYWATDSVSWTAIQMN